MTASPVGQWYRFLQKEMITEWRNPYAVQGAFLYVFCTVFIGYYSFRFIDPQTWSALFWVVMVFVAVNTVSRGFSLENRERMFYYYTLTSPLVVYFARLTYNVIFMLVVSIMTALAFTLFLGNVVGSISYFFILLLLASLCFGSTFTLISALAFRAGNSMTMASILGFPLVIPQLILLVSQSSRAIEGLPLSGGAEEMIGLLSIALLTTVVSYMIFPYLWSE